MVKAICEFCHKKGWSIAKGRPKGEAKAITITSELYEQLLQELKFKEVNEEQKVPQKSN